MPLGPSFETIVRPSVVPDIRPPATPKVVPFSDPGQGFAVINGNPAKQLNLTTTTSVSVSRSQGSEVERRYDTVRIYQVDQNGNVNKDNFVDIQVANRLKKKTAQGTETTYYRPADLSDNVESLRTNDIKTTAG